MLEKKIADKLKNHEIDPQDGAFFEKIMQERGKRNTKSGFLLMGSIAIMFLLITGFSVSKYWDKLPADGFTREQVAQIKAAEAAARDSAIKSHEAIRAQQRQEQELANQTKIESEQNSVTDIVELNTNQQGNTVSPSAQTRKGIANNKGFKQKQTLSTSNNRKGWSKTNKTTSKKNGVDIQPNTPQTINPTNIETNLKRKRDFNVAEFSSSKRFLKPLNTNPNFDAMANYSATQLTPNHNTDKKDGKDIKDGKDNKNFIPYKFWPRELNFYAGTFYNQRFINDQNNSYAAKINELEKVRSTSLIGLNAEYHLKKSIFAQIGFQWMTIESDIQAVSKQFVNHSQQTVQDPGGNPRVIDVYDTSYVSTLGGTNSNNYFEIPLTFGARWQLNKHIIQPQIGVVTAFYGKSKGLGINTNGETSAIANKQDRLSSINAQAITGFTYTYVFAKRLGVYVNPNLRYSLTNHTKKSYGFSQYNSMVGVQVGLKYILK